MVPFRIECGLFITLNPYAIGRSKLPSNLQSLFRMVAMTVPDSSLIAHVILMNAGFEKAKTISEKILNVF
jgi:dynein heavy chain, axonemal